MDGWMDGRRGGRDGNETKNKWGRKKRKHTPKMHVRCQSVRRVDALPTRSLQACPRLCLDVLFVGGCRYPSEIPILLLREASSPLSRLYFHPLDLSASALFSAHPKAMLAPVKKMALAQHVAKHAHTLIGMLSLRCVALRCVALRCCTHITITHHASQSHSLCPIRFHTGCGVEGS